jgi:hypothetical protein
MIPLACVGHRARGWQAIARRSTLRRSRCSTFTEGFELAMYLKSTTYAACVSSLLHLERASLKFVDSAFQVVPRRV